MKNFQDYISSSETSILKDWNYLHGIAESAFKEHNTSRWLTERLSAAGFDVKTGIGGTGVIGRYDTGVKGPQIGLRADMDALPFEINGEKTCVHACGHDANCTEVLWAAITIRQCNLMKCGCLTVLFQPGEESLCGADKIIESGELEHLDYLIGIHLRPIEELPLGKIAPAVFHGASGSINIVVSGENAHGARPQQGVNAIEAASLIISAIQALPFDPTIPHSVKPTCITSGDSAVNIIPASVAMIFDVRAQSNELMDAIKTRVCDAAGHAAASIGARAECKWRGGVPAGHHFDQLIKLVACSIKEACGDDFLADAIYTSGGEDFHKYSVAYPNLQSVVIGVGADLKPGLHKANMQFDPSAMISAVRVLTTVVLNLLKDVDSKQVSQQNQFKDGNL